jgi:hypothetical protein
MMGLPLYQIDAFADDRERHGLSLWPRDGRWMGRSPGNEPSETAFLPQADGFNRAGLLQPWK